MMRASSSLILFGGSKYLPEARSLFAAMSVQPDATRKALINARIAALKAALLWDSLDLIYFLAAHDSQAALLNWKNPGAFTAIEVNGPLTFVVDRGFTGNGTSQRLRTQYVPSANGVNLIRDTASAWMWSLTDVQSTTYDIGSNITAGIRVCSRSAGNTIVGRVNDGTDSTDAVITSVGLTGVSRPSSGVKRLWRNGIQEGSDFAVASTAIETAEQWICASNSASFSTRQIAFAAWGDSLAGKELAFYNAVLAYMQGVGAA